MKAIILAAGRGRRLSATTEGMPKCLLPIGGRRLLDRLLASLRKAGVDEAIVVIGFNRERIKEAIANRQGGLPVRFIVNPEFEKGAILSLWAAREEFTGDLLIMDADVLCSDELIARLVRSPNRNCFLLDGRVKGTGEEMMLMAREGRVLDIARTAKPGYDTVGESVGFLKVSRADAPGLLDALRRRIESGGEHLDHEDAYPLFMRDQVVGYERVDDLPWAEIDFPEDIEFAERILVPMIDA